MPSSSSSSRLQLSLWYSGAKAKDYALSGQEQQALEQEIKEINIAIEGYKMAFDEIWHMKIWNEVGKEQLPDYFEYLPDKFNKYFTACRNIIRKMKINKAKSDAAEKRTDALYEYSKVSEEEAAS